MLLQTCLESSALLGSLLLLPVPLQVRGSFQFWARSKAERRIGSFSHPEAEAGKGNFGLVQNTYSCRSPPSVTGPGRETRRRAAAAAPRGGLGLFRGVPRTDVVAAASLQGNVFGLGCEGKALPRGRWARHSSPGHGLELPGLGGICPSYQGFDVQLRSTKVFHRISTKQKLSEIVLKN